MERSAPPIISFIDVDLELLKVEKGCSCISLSSDMHHIQTENIFSKRIGSVLDQSVNSIHIAFKGG